MAEVNPPLWLQAGSYPAQRDRELLAALAGYGDGVFSSADLLVQAQSTPNMSVRVAAGGAFVKGSESATQGTYFVRNDAEKTITIAAADATNPRKDIIVARVRDAAFSGAVNEFALEVVAGTPAASPAEPALPASSYKLAVVTVPAAASSITSGNIADSRLLNTVVGLADAVVTSAKLVSGAVLSKHFAPVVGLAEATSSPSLTGSWADIPGASVTLNLAGQVAGMSALVFGAVGFVSSGPSTRRGEGRLVVDGSASGQIMARTSVDSDRVVQSKIWLVTGLSAAAHTFKLQAIQVTGSGMSVAADHTSIAAIAFKG